jgi:hypothetical protein
MIQAMITRDNYFDEIGSLDLASMGQAIEEGHKFLAKSTDGGKDWDMYYESEKIRETIDLYLSSLNDEIKRTKRPGSQPTAAKESQGKAKADKAKLKNPPECRPAAKKQNKAANPKTAKSTVAKKGKSPKKSAQSKGSNPKPTKSSVELVRDLDMELRLMNRFRALDSKPRTFSQVLSVLNAINRAVSKGEIRKTRNPTKYHKEIEWIQEKLAKALETAYGGTDPNEAKTLEFDKATVERIKSIWNGYQVYPSVRLGLRYFAMEGKSPDIQKAAGLLAEIERAGGNGRIAKDDPNAPFLRKVAASLKEYVDGRSGTVKIHEAVLSGLAGAVLGCACQDGKKKGGTMNGYGQTTYQIIDYPDQTDERDEPDWDDEDDNEATPPKRRGGYIIPPPKGNAISFQASRMPSSHEETYTFTGRWGQLFGSPIKGFSAMIYGKPKGGKSTLAVDFGGYLAKSFGNVLYASIEEGARGTITERIGRMGANHQRMTVTNHLPADLGPYQFVIVDSVSRGQMDIGDLRDLIRQWPGISFIFIFHVTKEGLPRGTSEFQHEVDVIVEVKDGMATAVGRFGPGETNVRYN